MNLFERIIEIAFILIRRSRSCLAEVFAGLSLFSNLSGLKKKNNFFEFDLQLFAEDSPTGQKTEEATPWRREEARKQGQVAKSIDLVTVIILLFGFLALFFAGKSMLQEMMRYSIKLFEHLDMEISMATMPSLLAEFLYSMGVTLFPVFIITFTGILVASFGQVGFYVTFEPLKPNLGRLNPVTGFKRIFSMQSLMELFKAIFKLLAVAYIPYNFLVNSYNEYVSMFATGAHEILAKLSIMTFRVSMQVVLVLLIIAVIDYIYQRYEFEKSIMMSKYDVMQEMKQHEGDPRLKQAMRQKMRALASRRMMEAIPKAEVVITNPIHLSVALAYDGDRYRAPTVVAKGAGQIAERIKEIAKEHGIPLYEHKPLAQALYKNVDIGEEIPPDLYVPVAEVLAFVYKMKKRVA